MKYDLIYQSVMEEELKIAEGQMPEYGKGRHKSTYEWIAIYGSLLYPGLHPHETYDRLQKTFIKYPMMITGQFCTAATLTTKIEGGMSLILSKTARHY